MKGVGVTALMVAALCLEVGLNTLIKAATTKGMSNFVFVVYSNAMALCFLLPSTFIYHRKKAFPPISGSTIFRIFVLSLISCAEQTLMYTGIKYGSPTLASAMVDLVPAFTFVLAIVSRMEKLDLKLQSSQGKSIGTLVSITGALIVTLYKGMPLTSAFPEPQDNKQVLRFLSPHSQWLFGAFLLVAAAFCLSLIFIVKTWIIKDYPAELMVTTITCSFVLTLSPIVALIAEKNPKAWLLELDMEFVTILYSAIFVVSIRNIVHIWACRKKGPIYVAMFNPLGMVVALVMGVVFLGDILFLGSMIGGAIIAIGFYAVIWGQAQEEKMDNEKNGICSFVSSAAPLLQNKSMDV